MHHIRRAETIIVIMGEESTPQMVATDMYVSQLRPGGVIRSILRTCPGLILQYGRKSEWHV